MLLFPISERSSIYAKCLFYFIYRDAYAGASAPYLPPVFYYQLQQNLTFARRDVNRAEPERRPEPRPRPIPPARGRRGQQLPPDFDGV